MLGGPFEIGVEKRALVMLTMIQVVVTKAIDHVEEILHSPLMQGLVVQHVSCGCRVSA